MNYICLDCGKRFNHFKRVEESRGEFWGIPCSETMYYCPHCGSDYCADSYDEIEPYNNGYTLFWQGDEIYFDYYEDAVAELDRLRALALAEEA